MNKVYALGAVAVLSLAGAFGVIQASHPGPALKRIHDPGHVTYSIHLTACYARDRGKLPDRSCTPGSIEPAVTQRDISSTICRIGWTKKVRPPESQTQQAKYRVSYPAYHIPSRIMSELDHLVPLELGGSNDITNLWPEVGKVPNAKDKVENAMNDAVCDGTIRLAAAQLAIASDWITAEARLGLSPAPRPSPPPSTLPSPTRTVSVLSCAASMSNPRPSDYTTDYVDLTTAPYAAVAAVAYYKTTSTRKTGEADGSGRASIGYYISRATIGYTVSVSVTVTSNGRTAPCSTSFTPSG